MTRKATQEDTEELTGFAALQKKVATSLCVSTLALLFFGSIWIVGCPAWMDRFAAWWCPMLFANYLTIVPLLGVLGILFGARDMLRPGFRKQALMALLIAFSLLAYYALHPPEM